MSEIDKLLSLWAHSEEAGEDAVLATVVKTQGSSYRLPGARLLITRPGARAGSVSGGCLEDDLVRKAWWLTESGAFVRRYDTTPDGEIAMEFGLGCNGIIHVLLERVSAGNRVMSLIRESRLRRASAVIAHLLQPAEHVGSRLILDTAGHISHDIADEALADALGAASRAARARHEPCLYNDSRCEAFVETLAPAIRLLIFGAGDDAVALASLAKHFGWQVEVYDGRAHYARADRFPMVDTVVTRLPGMIRELTLDPWTVAVTMSHSYTQDLEVLTELSGVSPLPYVGVLGPRKRAEQMFREAGLEQWADSSNLNTPMGLDIGAEGPDQVALAVVSEIQAVMNGRKGGPLSQRLGSIHAHDNYSGVEAGDAPVPFGVCA